MLIDKVAEVVALFTLPFAWTTLHFTKLHLAVTLMITIIPLKNIFHTGCLLSIFRLFATEIRLVLGKILLYKVELYNMLRFTIWIFYGLSLFENRGLFIEVLKMLWWSNRNLMMSCSSTTILRYTLYTCYRMCVRLGLVNLVQEVVCNNSLSEGYCLIMILGVNQCLFDSILNILLESNFANWHF